jgi:DNA-binding response OmpR family regulator
MSKKILLVDDEEDTATVFQTVLKQGGFEVVIANNGTSALATAKTGGFDLILLDQMMPDMSGTDVLKHLKEDSSTSKVPVAMLTNFSHDELVKESLNRGAIDYILKYQISHEDLLKKVKGILES